jgi:hypothetical protein
VTVYSWFCLLCVFRSQPHLHYTLQIVAQSVDVKELERLDFFPADDFSMVPASNKAVVASSRHNSESQIENGIGRVSLLTEFLWLAKRDFKSIKRNPMVLGARLVLSSFMSFLSGLIFFQIAGKETVDPIVSILV